MWTGDGPRELVSLAVPQGGRAGGHSDRDESRAGCSVRKGLAVEAVSAFFADLLAAGRSEATASLLRDGPAALVPVPLGARGRLGTGRRERGTGFLPLVAGRRQAAAAALAQRGQAGAAAPDAAGEAYAPSVRAHSETVLRSFYEFHREAGTGPIMNPFPLDRSRRGGRANAHHNPMEPYRGDRAGLYRPRVPARVPGGPRRGVQRDLRPPGLEPGPGARRFLRLDRGQGL